MSKCDKCVMRKVFARKFDEHWLGKEDCPLNCELVQHMPNFDFSGLEKKDDEHGTQPDTQTADK